MKRFLAVLAALIAAALVWAPLVRAFAPPADSAFLRKANAFVGDYNALISELQNGVANPKRFRQVAKAWEALYADPGWLK